MAKFEYERGMATSARAALKAYFMARGNSEEQALFMIDNMSDGRLRWWYGKVRKEEAMDKAALKA